VKSPISTIRGTAHHESWSNRSRYEWRQSYVQNVPCCNLQNYRKFLQKEVHQATSKLDEVSLVFWEFVCCHQKLFCWITVRHDAYKGQQYCVVTVTFHCGERNILFNTNIVRFNVTFYWRIPTNGTDYIFWIIWQIWIIKVRSYSNLDQSGFDIATFHWRSWHFYCSKI